MRASIAPEVPAYTPASALVRTLNRGALGLMHNVSSLGRKAAACRAEPPLDLGPPEHLSVPDRRDRFGEPRIATRPRPDRVRGDAETPTNFGDVDEIGNEHVSHDLRLGTKPSCVHRERARRGERGTVLHTPRRAASSGSPRLRSSRHRRYAQQQSCFAWSDGRRDEPFQGREGSSHRETGHPTRDTRAGWAPSGRFFLP